MPNDKSNKPEGQGARPKRPTTIDLKASEIKAAEPPPADTGPAETAAAAAKEKADARAEAAAGAAAPPPRDFMNGLRDRMPANLPWPIIAASGAAAILFFAIGIGAGHWLSRGVVPAAVVTEPAQPTAELLARLMKVEAALSASGQTDPQLLARIAAAEASVKTAADIAAARDRRNDEIAAMAREARERAASAAAAAEAAQKAGAVSSDPSRGDVDALGGRIAALETSARALQVELAKRTADPADAARSRFAVAVMALRNAVETGAPFPAELAAVRALSGDAKAIAALEPFAKEGVPAADVLSRELASTMPSIWRATRGTEPNEGTFLEKLQANAGRIVRIRPAGEIAGDDPSSVRARIEMRAASADIRGALTELSKLPPDARAPAESWIKKAQARDAALAAARSLSDQALTALAKTGS